MYPTRQTRAVCIMLKQNKVLLIHRVKNGDEYWTFPGGGVEKEEAVEEAVVREVKEETSMPTKVERLLYVHHYEKSDQYYYSCKYISGEPILGNSVEKERMEKESNDIYKPEWVNANKLPDLLVYPLEIRDWLIEDLKNGFKNKPRELTIKASKLR